jgi:integrase/recombinase XerC
MIGRYLTFCKEVRCLREKTIKEYFYILNTIGRYLDYLKPGDQSAIERSILQAKESGSVKWSQQYTAKVSCVVMRFFSWLAAENILPFNPYIYQRFKRPRPKEPKYLTQKEFDFITNNPMLSHQDQTMLRLAWDSGVRKSELLGFNQQDIDLDDCVSYVRNSKGNYSDGRCVPFTQVTADYLRFQISVLRSHGIKDSLFVDHDWNRMGESACDKRIREIATLRSPGREPIYFHLHTLRHSFANRALAAGLEQITVMKILGHSSLAMTNLYLHHSKEDVKAAYEKILAS